DALLSRPATHLGDRSTPRGLADSAARCLLRPRGLAVHVLGVAIPAIAVGVIAWFYLKDDPSEANWLTRCCPHRGWVRGWLVGGPSARCGRGDDYRCGGRRGALRG